jgi:hypothetical protein
VLVTAEIIAEVTYAAIREATGSTILRRLCDQILRDEVRHVQFQTDQLARLRADRPWWGRAATLAAQRVLFAGTALVVWLGHRSAIRRGGFALWSWRRACRRAFDEAFAARPEAAAPAAMSASEATTAPRSAPDS